MPKLVFVLLDGLNYSAAASQMCYLQALTQAGDARFFRIRSLLPPLSRPLYSTLLTGLPPLRHGILRNETQKQAPKPNIFTALATSGFSSCAGAYAWFYELLTGEMFKLNANRIWRPDNGPLKAASFYASDAYPDAELFADCEALRKAYEPDFLFVHSMGVDWAGHCHGGQSPEYANAAGHVDGLLAEYIPIWRAAGCHLLICSDHGMAATGGHYANESAVLDVPLWLVGDWPQTDAPLQTEIAGMATGFFGLEKIPHQNNGKNGNFEFAKSAKRHIQK